MSQIHNMCICGVCTICTLVRICTVHVSICEKCSEQHMALAMSSPDKLELLRPPMVGSGCQLCKQHSCHSNLDITISLWQPSER